MSFRITTRCITLAAVPLDAQRSATTKAAMCESASMLCVCHEDHLPSGHVTFDTRYRVWLISGWLAAALSPGERALAIGPMAQCHKLGYPTLAVQG